MKKNSLIYLALIICISYTGYAQVSHGGRPLPPVVQTRSALVVPFEEMAGFDLEEELRLDALEGNDLRGGYRFAYKFMTDFNRANSGVTFTLPDGTLVWRLGIRSEGALSINILFSEYELPEGAQVFLYNPSQTQVLGAFNHLNNSELGILPVAPVRGSELIIEYREPACAAFPGKLSIGEVNHAYRSLRGYEPMGDRKEYGCMPSPVCLDSLGLDTISRSTVLLTIDGVRACSGVMVNNTAHDGKPYLMTASHCLNDNFTMPNPDYAAIAGRIVCFFNYNSPTCDTVMRGTEEMSVASAHCRAVNTRSDMALLELLETPPSYYRPFYAGWTIDDKGGTAPYTGLHHPRASVKRVSLIESALVLKTFPTMNFYSNAHWNVANYTTGCTDSGSSGGPLFDSEKRLVGLLSGGQSTCDSPKDDFYYALFKAWEPSGNPEEQLRCWLNPANSSHKAINGLNPYADSPCYRMSHILEVRLSDSITVTPHPVSGNLFGTNPLRTVEYAEEYYAGSNVQVEGLYLVTPSITDEAGSLQVEASIYNSSGGKPYTLLYSETFSPAYRELQLSNDSLVETPKRLNRAQESFVRLANPVEVNGTFFVAYRILSPSNSSFAVYNLRKGQQVQNTAWIHSGNNWVPASQHPSLAFSTSLFLDPVVRYSSGNSNEQVKEEALAGIFTDSGRNALHLVIYEEVESALFELYATNGRQLISQTVEGRTAQIPVAPYKPGVYIAHLRWKNHTYTQKVVL